MQSFLAELAQKNTGAIRCLCFSAEAAGCRCPSDSFGGRGETRGRLFVSHDSLHGECHGLVGRTVAHGDLLEEGSRLFGREMHRKEHLLAGLYGLAVVCDLRAVARRVGLYHHDGLVRTVPGSDAHLAAPAERKLAQIDRPVVEQQHLVGIRFTALHIDRLLQRGEVGSGQSPRPVRCATTGDERQQQQQNPMSVDHGRQFSGTYSPSWVSIFSKVDLNKFHIEAFAIGFPTNTIRLYLSNSII